MNTGLVIALLAVNSVLLIVIVFGGSFGLNFLRKIARDVEKDLKENVKIADNLYQAIITPRDPALPYQKRGKDDL